MKWDEQTWKEFQEFDKTGGLWGDFRWVKNKANNWNDFLNLKRNISYKTIIEEFIFYNKVKEVLGEDLSTPKK